uniref:Phosphatidylinositol-glycan biosynthesis class X protein n=2 Tax=Caenorhabditis japonica TaxID=281687 RepID=A0A8R1IS80_CAEJA
MGIFRLLILCVFILRKSCVFSILQRHETEMKITGSGLHRTLQIQTFNQVKSRISTCRLLHKIELPESVLVHEHELETTLADYNILIVPTGNNALSTTVYVIRKKKFSSTFEMKDQLKFPIHLYAPKKSSSPFVNFEYPTIGFDCENNHMTNCSALTVHNDSTLKPVFGKWMTAIKSSSKFLKLNIFNGERFEQFAWHSCFILLALVVFSAYYITF